MEKLKSVQEAISLLAIGKPLVVERTEDRATYLEYVHGEIAMTTYNNLGDLLEWKVLSKPQVNKLIEKIIKEWKDV